MKHLSSMHPTFLGPLLAAVLAAQAPASHAVQELDTNPCAGRSQASCQALGMTTKPLVAWRNALNAAEGRETDKRLSKMLELVLQAPQLREPRGMSLHPSMVASAPPANAVKHHPAVIEATVLAKLITVEDKRAKQDKTTGAWIGTGEGPMLRMRFNDLGAFLSATPVDYATPAQYFYEPARIGEVGGFPVYRVDGKEVLLIHKREALPWRPYSVERYVQARIADEEKTHAVFATQPASANASERAHVDRANAERKARIDAMKQQLSQLTQEQREAGACEAGKRRRGDALGLDLACGSGSTRLVEPNPDMFLRAAPRNALQVLSISTTWGVLDKNDRMPNALGRTMRAALQDIDLKAVQAMLD